MPPLWKIKRELKRIYLNALLLSEAGLSRVRRNRYDRSKIRLLNSRSGRQRLMENVAVYLIYQPKAVLQSTYRTCRYLEENGFSTIVVSNTELSVVDREKLLDHCFVLIERPNVGYDFGGYRDGILSLLDNGIVPQNLLVLNDSIWFPVLKNCRYLADLKTQNADIFGPILSVDEMRPERDHLQSYMFNFKSSLVRLPEFREYWQSLPLSSNKSFVIRNFEKKLTRMMQALGSTSAHLLTKHDSLRVAATLPNDELRKLAEYDGKNYSAIATDLAELPADPAEARSLILWSFGKNIERRYLLKDHPITLLRELGLPVLKKDRAPAYARQRSAIFTSGLCDLVDDVVLDEIATWDETSRS